MVSLAEKMNGRPITATNERKVYYPSITLDEKQMKELKDKKIGYKFILNISAEITGINQHNEEPKRYTIELQKGEMKRIRIGG